MAGHISKAATPGYPHPWHCKYGHVIVIKKIVGPRLILCGMLICMQDWIWQMPGPLLGRQTGMRQQVI